MKRPHNPKLACWLHRLRMPTLQVWGDSDRLVPMQQAEVWAASIPNAKVRTFKHAGHLVLDEKPEAVVEVAEFLKAP
ncbi:MAG: alpha/beta fold hydrolase [Candidatus Binataceae bacterium]